MTYRSLRGPGCAFCLRLCLLLMPATISVGANAQRNRNPAGTPGSAPGANSAATVAATPAPNVAPVRDAAPPVVTRHEIMVHGTPLTYTATTGMMPMRGATGETEANIFFVAYHRTDGAGANPDPRRPLVFAFNGGPGSASVWLHLGAIGPKRVQMLPDGGLPPPPYHLVDNEQTWLDQSDLVFLDPVGTGYSRPTKPEYGAKFWGLQGDIAAAGDFIRLYLTRYKRWGSPLFLAGESYGTTRAAGLSNYLVEHGIALNGIALLSSVLNFQTLEFRPGNDLPYMLFLPTYTATAFYHHKLPDALQKDLTSTLKEAETWAQTDYANALAQGDRLTSSQRQAAIDKMARYTGLSKTYLDNSDLRVDIESFCKELLRDRKHSVGRLDSRFVGLELVQRIADAGFRPEPVRHSPAVHRDDEYVRQRRVEIRFG